MSNTAASKPEISNKTTAGDYRRQADIFKPLSESLVELRVDCGRLRFQTCKSEGQDSYFFLWFFHISRRIGLFINFKWISSDTTLCGNTIWALNKLCNITHRNMCGRDITHFHHYSWWADVSEASHLPYWTAAVGFCAVTKQKIIFHSAHQNLHIHFHLKQKDLYLFLWDSGIFSAKTQKTETINLKIQRHTGGWWWWSPDKHIPETLTYFRFTIFSSFVSWSLRAGIALASLDTAMRNSWNTQQALNRKNVQKRHDSRMQLGRGG